MEFYVPLACIHIPRANSYRLNHTFFCLVILKVGSNTMNSDRRKDVAYDVGKPIPKGKI